MKRTTAYPSLLLVMAVSTASFVHAQTEPTPSAAQPLVQGIDCVGITVRDMDRSVQFYGNVLRFEKVSDVEVAGDVYEHAEGLFGLRMRVVRMKLGDESIELTEYLTPRGRPVPVDSRSEDRWFQHIAIIVSDMDQAYARLREFKVEHASTGPQRIPDWNKGAAGIRAFYFKDPDEHVLEVLSFPPDKGMAKWHATDKLFLGIDHTAIVVADTDASVHFYRDTLGLPVAGQGENYGTEQEHLNNVFGARLRITSLRGAKGPAVELLQYLAPTDGRPYPGDTRASDLWSWQTRMIAPDPAAADEALRAAHVQHVSPGAVEAPGGELGYHAAVLVRDPDGHAMQLARP